MNPTHFKEENYFSPNEGIPVHEDGNAIITCWKMTVRERVKALLFGVVWVSVLGHTIPPMAMILDKPFRKYRYEVTSAAAPVHGEVHLEAADEGD